MIRTLTALLMVVALAGCGDDTQPAGSGGTGGTSGSGGSGGTGGTGGSGGSGGSGGIDAPMIDASGNMDGLPGDAQLNTCIDYCSCMLSSSHCLGSTGGYTSGQEATCLTNCALFTMPQLECRTAHCMLAPDNTSVHCQHAIGMGAGVPGACQ